MLEPLGGGRFLIRTGDRSHVAYGATAHGRTWVFIDGRTFVFESSASDETSRPSRSDDALALSAPMPGTVRAIRVSVGQEVNEGDTAIVLEAMKLEVPIRMPRAGRVSAINCREGELVQPGTPLLELES